MFRKNARSKQKSTARALITKLNPRSPVTEQYRTIRTNLQFSAVDEEFHTVMLTSAGPGEGKSMTAANLAVVYAQQDKKVLLVDADMRKPTVHYTFGLTNMTGLSNVLVGETILTDAINSTDVPNLEVMSCGPIPPNPSELLGSKRMRAFIQHARDQYDMIIFDTPPVLAVTDAQILANICDGSLLVVRSKVTDTDGAKKAIELLNAADTKILGTVLNDVEAKNSNYYYYYGS
ncbi:putative tyrosine-protein kinase CapB [Lentibacillus sp. JNUCC-1]|uniref:CpsD/CapB family tyrosine-protein kinase n=1 Tax=Lentibacillus sp. JNUCC-1 TaxID=2654513 RepID=UPI0012E74F00|nr:CpsD/CapB family tyrosine-protein kinase [Lentibacillus sp. JNUCC-1]MUV37287.1 putative tyrosine-protein kinase CapB [Lentibacillus sp. JNUCC-1]